jgi:hypothetical protein
MKMTAQKRALDKIYKRRNRYEIPEWQREKVWDKAKKQKLIDTILRGWKLPKFYLLKISSNPEEFEVLDGQQRLETIFEFFDNELSLSDESAEEFGGEYYRDLPAEVSDQFDDFEIEYDEIEDAGEKEQREFFQRLQEGLPLTSSEKLNSAHSKLRDFGRTLSKHSFFRSKVTASDKRYGHFDIVAKVAALAIEGIDTGLRYDDLKETFESQRNFSSRSNTAKRLTETFNCLDSIFQDRDPLLKNRTVVQSFATLVYRIGENNGLSSRHAALRKFFQNFMAELTTQVELGQEATDPAYITFQRTVNANVRGAAKTRQQILLRKLLAFDPSIAELLDPASIAESGVTGNIKQAGDTIAELVARINDAYSGACGSDLFKPTNKTARALTELGKPIAKFADYEQLVGHLYFLFHEGVGTRLDAQTPQSFKDINDLRTELQHDVDHGKKSKVASKRRKLGATFQKYAGELSPRTLAPERFPLVQDAILSALQSDLRKLETLAASGGL